MGIRSAECGLQPPMQAIKTHRQRNDEPAHDLRLATGSFECRSPEHAFVDPDQRPPADKLLQHIGEPGFGIDRGEGAP
jgi:hypothetical protein